MIIVSLFFSYLILIALGFSVWQFLGEKKEIKKAREILKVAAISFGIGMGAAYAILFGLSLMGIPWSLLNILLTSLLTIFILNVINYKRGKLILPRWKNPKLTKLEIALLGVILIFLLKLLIDEFIAPIYGWDALSIWLLKARAFYVDRGVRHQFFQRGDLAAFIHPEYPLLMPLSLDWLFLFLGFVDRLWVKSLFFITYLILLVFFYLGVKRVWSRPLSLFWTIVLASMPFLLEHAAYGAVGFADLTVAFYFLGAIFLYLEDQPTASALFLLFGALSKNEGMVFALTFGLLNLLFRREWRYLAYFVLGILPNFLWLKYVGVRQEYLSLIPERNFLATLSPVLHYFREEFRKIRYWHLTFYVFGLMSLLSIKEIIRNKKMLIIFLAFLAQIVAYFLTYVISPRDTLLQITTSISRLTLQIAPIFLLMGLILLKNYFSDNELG